MQTNEAKKASTHPLRNAMLGAILCVAASVTIAADLTVFAAASLKESLDEQVKVFAAKHKDTQVRVSYAGSNALAKQIESGAPANLFISADEEWMDYLAEKKLIVPASLRMLVSNDLVMIAPVATAKPITIAPGFALSAALGGGRLAVANPDAVPAGKYAKAALTKLGVWTTVEKQLARAENVRAALTFVARAEAPMAIVYRTDALAEPRVSIIATFPSDSHPVIVYPAAIVSSQSTVEAKIFLDYLASSEVQAVWKRFGFGVPK